MNTGTGARVLASMLTAGMQKTLVPGPVGTGRGLYLLKVAHKEYFATDCILFFKKLYN
jgi:hypothetical protein